jgi:hypothetical protein
MMTVALGTTAVWLLQLWTVCAVATFSLHAGVSLVVDRRFIPGLWEQWALALMMLLGPFGVGLEMMLIWKVFQDIRGQRATGGCKGRSGSGTAPAHFRTGTELQ